MTIPVSAVTTPGLSEWAVPKAAGGDWSVISAIIEEVSNHFQPVVYVLTESDLPDVRR